MKAKRIQFYKFCLRHINEYPNYNNYICMFPSYFHNKYFELKNSMYEYELFREVSSISWMHNQVLKEEGMECFNNKLVNEYRVFILQLCIEMLK